MAANRVPASVGVNPLVTTTTSRIAEDRAEAGPDDAGGPAPGQLLQLTPVLGTDLGRLGHWRARVLRSDLVGTACSAPVSRWSAGADPVAAGRTVGAHHQRGQRQTLAADQTGDVLDGARTGLAGPHDDQAQVGSTEERLTLGAVDAGGLDDHEVPLGDQRGQDAADPVGDEQFAALVVEAAVVEQRQQRLDAGLEQLDDVEPLVEEGLGQSLVVHADAARGRRPVGPHQHDAVAGPGEGLCHRLGDRSVGPAGAHGSDRDHVRPGLEVEQARADAPDRGVDRGRVATPAHAVAPVALRDRGHHGDAERLDVVPGPDHATGPLEERARPRSRGPGRPARSRRAARSR